MLCYAADISLITLLLVMPIQCSATISNPPHSSIQPSTQTHWHWLFRRDVKAKTTAADEHVSKRGCVHSKKEVTNDSIYSKEGSVKSAGLENEKKIEYDWHIYHLMLILRIGQIVSSTLNYLGILFVQ